MTIMTNTRVSAQVPDGRGGTEEKIFVYNRHRPPLGSGYTSIVYEGWPEGSSAADERVAIKVARSGSDADMKRELAILDRLRADGGPGSQAVIWAVRGTELDTNLPPPTLIMEMIDGDNHLARRLTHIDDKEKSGADIRQREVVTVIAALQYAELLVRMAAKGVISLGDRKAADFRLVDDVARARSADEEALYSLLPDRAAPYRLVVLDWNRAEAIELDAGKAARGASATFARDQERKLNAGILADIQIFSRWWAEFALDRAIQSLPPIDDTEPSWAALTRGFRDILLRAAAAGSERGFRSAEQLQSALQAHARYLCLSAEEIINALGALERDRNPPQRTLREELLVLVDMAVRRGIAHDDDVLRHYRLLAESSAGNAQEVAAELLSSLEGSIFRREWGKLREAISRTRRNLGPMTVDSAAAHLLMLRWDTVGTMGQAYQSSSAISGTDAGIWGDVMRGLMTSMADLPDSGALAKARQIMATIQQRYARHEIEQRPLALLNAELDLWEAQDAGNTKAAVEKFEALGKLTTHYSEAEAYAEALRLAAPRLDKLLAAHRIRTSQKSLEEERRDALIKSVVALFRQVQDDNTGKQLPLRPHTAPATLRAHYQPLQTAYHDAKAGLRGVSRANDVETYINSADWLIALLDCLLARRVPQAAALLRGEGPVGGLPADLAEKSAFHFNLARNAFFGQWLVQIENRLKPNADPLWPQETEQYLAFFDIIDTDGSESDKNRAAKSRPALEAARSKQQELARSLGVFAYQNRNTSSPATAWRDFVEGVIKKDERGDVDRLLNEAIDAHVEVWQPPRLVDDALDADSQTQFYEGFRVETLLALRAAELLPKRLEELEKMTDQIKEMREKISEQTVYFNEGYAQDKALVDDWTRRMADDRLRFDSAKAELTDISTHNTPPALSGLIDTVATQKAALAGSLLVMATGHAARLELDAAEQALNLAEGFITPDSPQSGPSKSLRNGVTELKGYKASGDPALWNAIENLGHSLERSDIEQARKDWSRVTSLKKDWDKNDVLVLMGGRFAMPAALAAGGGPIASAPIASAPIASAPMASAPIASAPMASAPMASAPMASAPTASAAGQSRMSEETAPGATPPAPQPKTDPGTMPPTPQLMTDSIYKELRNPFFNQLDSRFPSSDSIRQAISKVENSFKSYRLHHQQLKDLGEKIGGLVEGSGFFTWDENKQMDETDNRAHLYILCRKITQLQEKRGF